VDITWPHHPRVNFHRWLRHQPETVL
jgi:hypothetical protein